MEHLGIVLSLVVLVFVSRSGAWGCLLGAETKSVALCLRSFLERKASLVHDLCR